MAWCRTGYKPLPEPLMTGFKSYWAPIPIIHNSESIWNLSKWQYFAFREIKYWQGSNDSHDDIMKWKHFPRHWPFVRGIHRSPVNSPYKGQWRGAWLFSLICAWINGWVTNREAGDLRGHRNHYDVTVMVNQARCLSNQSSFVYEHADFALYIIHRTVYWDLLSRKTIILSFYKVNVIPAGALAIIGTRTPAAMLCLEDSGPGREWVKIRGCFKWINPHAAAEWSSRRLPEWLCLKTLNVVDFNASRDRYVRRFDSQYIEDCSWQARHMT